MKIGRAPHAAADRDDPTRKERAQSGYSRTTAAGAYARLWHAAAAAAADLEPRYPLFRSVGDFARTRGLLVPGSFGSRETTAQWNRLDRPASTAQGTTQPVLTGRQTGQGTPWLRGGGGGGECAVRNKNPARGEHGLKVVLVVRVRRTVLARVDESTTGPLLGDGLQSLRTLSGKGTQRDESR